MAPTYVISWLLDTDPALRWQVERDLLDAPEQQWRVIEVGDGVVRLVNRADGRALGNQDGEEENRTLLTPAEDEGHPHQQWRLVPVG